ncbi:MAG: 50S ribosomal protein L24P [Candidatus Methanofastidiosum methylothiophilum]|uniref:Large ribosomal subunit protein uL24 n=1 Tax=Candidatus Methanofastidiosum methylothiophilum TaxID=1705564 RepID=A0A150IIZ4_9EURY|nr:MAG: 50S ribosomal protein L24P [Candidatus Methanofastidiosum methylthiophilus]KYC47084.1 MAG: 50S ribosomal protein L24P [Candidatus Methanofastidiosum methylthiophilus]KYC49518.1 MAG: 50S ribosomal protein L24P [Candidatus Methanofastidiosum methylthiophilus]
MMKKYSEKPSKQRKRHFNAPLHKKHNLMSSHLAVSLRSKVNARALPLRKGDKVRVMRGDFKDHEGEITKVDLKAIRVYVDGAVVEKADGTRIEYPIHPSNLEIIDIDRKDEMRDKAIERKGE